MDTAATQTHVDGTPAATDSRPETTIVTVAFENGDEIAALVAECASQFALGPHPIEHVIFWNSPRANLDDEDHGFYRVVHLGSDQNLGFARAFNAGASHARGDVLISLNADAILSLEQLNELTKLAADNRDTLFAPPLISNHHVTYGRRFYSIVDVFRARLHRRNPMLASDPNEVDWVLGACFAISSDLWHRIGGFDERYFLYFEDVDLCWRLWQSGCAVEVAPINPVRHIHNRASARMGRPLLHHIVSAGRYFAGAPARCFGKRPDTVQPHANG